LLTAARKQAWPKMLWEFPIMKEGDVQSRRAEKVKNEGREVNEEKRSLEEKEKRRSFRGKFKLFRLGRCRHECSTSRGRRD
jgi:hypothetical protein